MKKEILSPYRKLSNYNIKRVPINDCKFYYMPFDGIGIEDHFWLKYCVQSNYFEQWDIKYFWTLGGAKKYLDKKYIKLGYHLCETEEEFNRYKLLL